MEKERNNSSTDETHEHTVTIMGKAKKISLSKDKRKVNDLLTELKKQYPNELKDFKFNHTISVVLNGKVVKMNDEGEIEGNPVLAESSVLSLMPQIAGGN